MPKITKPIAVVYDGTRVVAIAEKNAIVNTPHEIVEYDSLSDVAIDFNVRGVTVPASVFQKYRSRLGSYVDAFAKFTVAE